ncbi:mucin-5B-like [Anopheles merus]|uniref:mucin-5B-like n=1 Tax=Anopheles merus TaxID=30066 RepID=UPI001BE4B571|nr:mucin-5B-like [Anopheles merus]
MRLQRLGRKIRCAAIIMACGYSCWVVVLLLSAGVFSTVSCGLGTPCKVLCENGAEMIPCDRKTEIFNCCGPCSEATCDNPSPTQECAEGCKAGCFCKADHVRLHAGGPCVPIGNCKQQRK